MHYNAARYALLAANLYPLSYQQWKQERRSSIHEEPELNAELSCSCSFIAESYDFSDWDHRFWEVEARGRFNAA